MRIKLVLAGALLALGLPGVVLAQGYYFSRTYPQGPYAGISIGYNTIHDHSFPVQSSLPPGSSGINPTLTGMVNTKSSDGFAAALTTGYDFGPVWFLGNVHAEGELGYRYNSVDSLRAHVAYPPDSYHIPETNFTFSNPTGNTQTISLLINFVNDFNPHSLFDPYIGGGAGLAWVSFNNYGFQLEGKQRLLDDSDVVFAWQGIAGIRSYLTATFAVDLSYHYFRTHDPSYTTASGQSIKSSYTANTVMLGVTYDY
jgi:opacity protein-like surface antigen